MAQIYKMLDEVGQCNEVVAGLGRTEMNSSNIIYPYNEVKAGGQSRISSMLCSLSRPFLPGFTGAVGLIYLQPIGGRKLQPQVVRPFVFLLAFIALRFNFMNAVPTIYPYVVDICLREKLVSSFNISFSSPFALEKRIRKHEAKTFQTFQAF
jgi:hypothetical protein